MVDENTRFVEVYRARGLPDAHVVRLSLEDREIPVLIENELLQGVVGELPFGWPTSPRVLVPEEDVDAALAFLQEHRHASDEFVSTLAPAPLAETQCLACGGELDEFGVCPSCGWTFKAEGGDLEEPVSELPSLWEVMRRAVGAPPEPQ